MMWPYMPWWSPGRRTFLSRSSKGPVALRPEGPTDRGGDDPDVGEVHLHCPGHLVHVDLGPLGSQVDREPAILVDAHAAPRLQANVLLAGGPKHTVDDHGRLRQR